MTNDGWQVFTNFATTAGFTTAAVSGVTGVVASYQTYASPNSSIMESERKLKRVESRLQGLSPQRREEIENSIRSGAFACKSLKDLQDQLDQLLDSHCRLLKRYDEATFAQRHFPYSDFRNRVSRLEDLAKELLHDTFKTTVPFVNDIDIGFDPKPSRLRPASSESPHAFSTLSAPFPDADAIPLPRV